MNPPEKEKEHPAMKNRTLHVKQPASGKLSPTASTADVASRFRHTLNHDSARRPSSISQIRRSSLAGSSTAGDVQPDLSIERRSGASPYLSSRWSGYSHPDKKKRRWVKQRRLEQHEH